MGGVTLGIYAIHQSVITAFLALIDDICEPKTAYIFFHLSPLDCSNRNKLFDLLGLKT